MNGDLTTLEKARDWLSGQTTLSTDNDALISRLISAASRFVLGYLNRQIAVTDYDEWYDSGGRNFLSLRQYPIISVSSIKFSGLDITEEAVGNPPGNGYIFSAPSRLEVRGWCFPRGRNVVRVQYQAGYATRGEAHTIETTGVAPDPIVVVPVTTDLKWLSDMGVTLGGVAMVLVSGSPTAGQYAVSSEGVYTFSADDAGSEVLISYSSVPADLEQAVIELVGERFRQKDRIGLNSKNLPNGETVAFMNRDMSEPIKMLLQRYRLEGVS